MAISGTGSPLTLKRELEDSVGLRLVSLSGYVHDSRRYQA